MAKKLVVWDSYRSLTTRLELEGYLEVMRTIVLALVDKCGVTVVRPNTPMTPWRVERVQNIRNRQGVGIVENLYVRFFRTLSLNWTCPPSLRQICLF